MNKIGIIGLGTMGSNLALNINKSKYSVSVYNRTAAVTETFIQTANKKDIFGAKTIQEFVTSLELPRKIILMVKPGQPVDDLITELLQFIEPGDIIMDFGNSYYLDSIRRHNFLKQKGIEFMDCGISGGEEGALNGASIMVGGDGNAWEKVRDIISKAAAKDFTGNKCIAYIGPSGTGHFVKMVHNGIEYGLMELIAETYDLLRSTEKLVPKDISQIFSKFNKKELKSYLIEITSKVLAQQDDFTQESLVNKISDVALQKGTGKWVVQDALNRGVPCSIISAGVESRNISAEKNQRIELSKIVGTTPIYKKININTLKKALVSGFVASYAQGLYMISIASQQESWKIDLSEVSRIWQGGCIIRANLLKNIQVEINSNAHLIGSDYFSKIINDNIKYLTKVVDLGLKSNVPVPAFYAALAYIQQISTENLPTNLIQGLRDYFGSHKYKRVDQEGDFHTLWN